MANYSIREYAVMHFAYGFTNGNGAQAAEEYASRYPGRFNVVEKPDGTFTGFDAEILGLITSTINASLKIYRADNSAKYGIKLRNGSFTGLLGDVLSWRADIASNGMFIKEYGSRDFKFTIPVDAEDLCIVVPAPVLVPNWKMVFRAFQVQVWVIMAFAVVTSMVVWYVLNVVAQSSPTLIDSFFYVGSALISTVKLKQRPWQRMFLLSLMTYHIVMAASFEGSLLRLLKQRSYEGEINTLQEFKDSKLNIYTFSSNLIEDSLPDYLRGRVLLLQNGLDTANTDLLEVTAVHRNSSYIGKKCDILERSRNLSGIYLVKECPRTYFVAYCMRKGNLWYRAVNTAVSRILAAGLNEAPKISLGCPKQTSLDKSNIAPRPLGIENVAVAMYLLRFGCTVSVIVFIGELLIVSIRNWCWRKIRKIRLKESRRIAHEK